MVLKVTDKFRKNRLSLKPGGITIRVEYIDGRQFDYDKIKHPEAYIRYSMKNPKVKRAWVVE